MIDKKATTNISSMQDQIKELQNLLTIATNKNEQLIKILEKIPQPSQSLNSKGKILNVNEKWCDELGYKKEEIIGRQFKDFLTSQTEQTYFNQFPNLIKNGHVSGVEFDMLHKNGNKITVSLDGVIINDDNGQMLYTSCIFTNITEQKKILNNLHNSKEKFRSLYENSPDMYISVSSEDSKILLCNETFLRKTGFTRDEIIGKSVFDLYDENAINDARKAFEQFITTGNVLDIPLILKKKDGSKINVDLNVSAVRDSNGKILYSISSYRDMTELKIAQEEIKLLNERMKRALFGNNDGIWDLNMLDNSVYFSPKWKEMIGYEDHELPNLYEIWENRVHPNDIANAKECIQDHIDAKTEYFEAIYRFKHKNNSWIWIQSRGKATYDQDGSPIKMTGTHHDITKQKLLELEIKKSHEKLQKLTENVPGAIYQYRLYTNGNSGFTYLSKSMKNVYDVSPEDALKDSRAILSYTHPDDKEIFELSILKSIETMEEWNLEYRVNLPKKGLRWIHVKSTPEKLSDGSILWSGILDDITEQKKKDKLIYEQSKLAAMGEMIGNIAHQWRQPLSIISTGATGMQLQKKYGLLTDELFDKTCIDINNNAQYLSRTIEDFKNFIRNDRIKVTFNLSENINSFLELVKGSIKNNNINLVLDLNDSIIIDGYPNELIQCLINIFNNAKDALKEKEITDKFIFISTSIKNDKVFIKIKDNAGGILPETLPRIFEPYFTTKNKSKGTGLGLSITYSLIVDGMQGSVKANNISYAHHNKEYLGAELSVKLPIS
ncbi:PAS domain S-box protein [Poseidonibacter antarcticus]|uniref:PAS domain S-box protein n=1 Tax=Poseidonibacter antarcticus TaxID=2478538 RepID=UPI000EF4F3A4|nr:PAS domain S-box protein [Poseidonibacter antarcticus]